ncbi:MAG: sigma-70 family RNA polymerase sigma factor [Opitutaceae bacterium]|nr:sigma-70 family RNA polymerase sigma factor [Opitutaceae bacterium]
MRPRPRSFATTRWSIVVRAGAREGTEAGEALAHLCRGYWYPLYAHVRRRGYAPHDAEDLTQAFFARVLERRTVGRADRGRGRFRSFMLTSLDHFLADERARAQAQKRGGGQFVVSIDAESAEERLRLEPADTRAPDREFDRAWAMALLETVVARLRAELEAAARGGLLEALSATLLGARETQPYGELAARLGMSEGAVKVAVHRLRRRYRALLEEEIAETVDSPDAAREELVHLLAALRG